MMRVKIRHVNDKAQEQVIIECVEERTEIKRIKAFALLSTSELTGTIDGRMYSFSLSEVYYFEAVDERVYAYTQDKIYGMKVRLYELESAYAEHHFVRASKSFLISIMKLQCIRPTLNGRFIAQMKNGEEVIISRQYVPELKRIVQGGR